MHVHVFGTSFIKGYFLLVSYVNESTGEFKFEKYKGQEAAWIEQIKICGDDGGKTPLQKACIVLRIEVYVFAIDNILKRL